MALRFTDTLEKNPEEIERPPLMPMGTYRWTVEKVPNVEEGVKNQWDVITYQLRCVGAEDDVDADDLEEYTKKAGPVTNVRQRHSFFFSLEDEGSFNTTLYNHKRFLEEHLRAEGKTMKELMANAVNQQCLATIKWVKDKNNDELYFANIGKTAPID